MPIFPHKCGGNSTRPKPLIYNKNAGFSLLEILIVLSIMGVMLALVSPRLVTSIESAKFSQTANIGAGTITHIRTEAVLYRKAFVIAPTQAGELQKGYIPKTLDLPDHWVITGDTLYITPSGLCSGGKITLISPKGRRASYAFSPPQCSPKRIAVQNTAS